MAERTKRPKKAEQWRQIIGSSEYNPETKYPGKQYRVQLKDDLFYIMVDEIQVLPNGDLIAKRKEELAYAFGAGSWLFCVPVSCLDGEEMVVGWHSRWLRS
jgi:hypothetical protein